jgi:lysine 2,3-aminomutase
MAHYKDKMKFQFEKSLPRGPYESIPMEKWQSWAWQASQALKNLNDFEKVYKLSQSEIDGFKSAEGNFQIRTTPYYATLAHPENPQDPLRLIQTPSFKELTPGYQQMKDPLNEEKNSVTLRLLHRYPDRVLFLVTDFCTVYCRFCTRKRFTGNNKAFLTEEDFSQSIDYIRKHPGIREVILSGGDPLTLSDAQLEKVLIALREIEHVEIIRIGTRMPVVNPYRVTEELVTMIRKYSPVFLMTHFNHPKEITFESAQAISRFVDHGIPVMNQMVLLNGINNHPAIVQALSRRLLYLRAKPYYMFQCDPSEGTDHLRTSIEDSLEIQKELWGNLSGLAMPNLSVDVPHGGGKVGYSPNFEISQSIEKRSYQGFDGVSADYINPPASQIQKPQGIEEYIAEWELLKNAKG